MKHKQFTCQLLYWHQEQNKRSLPWKNERDPYKIWLSEIILQQTRAEQGLKYYEAFTKQYPTVRALAAAPDAEVFKLWEGLGYYSRCRNLLHTARFIVTDLQGHFPDNYAGILSMKGIGPYTAAAISSFAYNLPHAVVDGNVFRVLSRCFNITTPVDSVQGKKEFTDLANTLLDKEAPAQYNQAIMDFGATVCKPANPLCTVCPQQRICIAYKLGKVAQLPVKGKSLAKKTRWFTYFVFTHRNKTLVSQRVKKDIWQNLYEFYLSETDALPAWSEKGLRDYLYNQFTVTNADAITISPFITQKLTHQTVLAQFIKVKLNVIPDILQCCQWLTRQQLEQLAFPKIINEYLTNMSQMSTLF